MIKKERAGAREGGVNPKILGGGNQKAKRQKTAPDGAATKKGEDAEAPHMGQKGHKSPRRDVFKTKAGEN